MKLKRLSTLWEIAHPYLVTGISPDERLIAIASSNSTETCITQIADIETGRVVCKSPGKFYAFVNDRLLITHHYTNNRLKKQITNIATGEIIGVENIGNPDSDHDDLLSASPDGDYHMRQISDRDWQLVHVPDEAVMGQYVADVVSFSPDGRFVALFAVLNGFYTTLVDGHSGEVLHTLPDIGFGEYCGDINLMICQNWKTYTIELIDLSTYEILLELPTDDYEMTPDRQLVYFNVRGKEGDYSLIYDLMARQPLRQFNGYFVTKVSPDGQWVELVDRPVSSVRYVAPIHGDDAPLPVGNRALFASWYIVASTGKTVDLYSWDHAHPPTMPAPRPPSAFASIHSDHVILRSLPSRNANPALPLNGREFVMEFSANPDDKCIVLGRYEDWMYVLHFSDQVAHSLDFEPGVSPGWIEDHHLRPLMLWDQIPFVDAYTPLDSLRSLQW